MTPMAAKPLFQHAVRFFSDRRERISGICDFIASGLALGEVCVVAAGPAVNKAVEVELGERGFNALADRAAFVDAEVAAQKLFEKSERAASVFAQLIAPLVTKAARASSTGQARVYGEIVDVLRVKGRRDYALAAEALWADLASRADFTMLCGYGADAVETDPCCWDYVEAHDVVLPSPHAGARDRAAERAVEKSLGERSWMVRAMVQGEPRLSMLPFGQGAPLWLKKHMPLAAARMLAAAR